MYLARELNRVTKEISSLIEDDLIRAGIFYRIIARTKSEISTKEKISLKKYDGKITFLRDMIGVRINLFFADDLRLIHEFLKSNYLFVEETVDQNLETEFKPTRVNLIFRIPDQLRKEFSDIVKDKEVDRTFEVQLRTILSEGWHEVDHDLRYKCPDDWNDHKDLSRFFNGILASLETSDWSIINLFESISYRHYKNFNLGAMFRTKLRIRISENQISPGLNEILLKDRKLQKLFYKIDRSKFIETMLRDNYLFPLKIDNLIFLLNDLYIKDEAIIALMPNGLINTFKLERRPIL